MLDISISIEDLTADLVKINSVIGNEKEICDEIEKVFIQNGLEFERLGNSIIGRLNFKKERTIALVGHLDSVPQSRENQTQPKIEGNKLTGLGACDMKCGIAAALKILHDVKSGAIQPKHNLLFVLYDGEEGPLPNGITRLLNADKFNNVDFAYILEPTSSKYSVGCLGSLMVKLVFQGISAHSANPKEGINALSEAAEIIKKVEEIDRKINKMQKIGGLPFYETINITQLTTENAANVIPQTANMTINYRFSPKKTAEEAEKFIRSFINKNLIYKIGVSNSCIIQPEKTQGFLQDKIECEIMQAWTDIAQLNAAGIPAINFGAGDIKICHKPEEFVNIEELKEFYQLLKTHV